MQALAQSGLVDGRYRVVRWIGQGACAAVYEAVDMAADDRPVAIKVMNAELVASPTIKKRFVQEAEAAVHIDSPFVVGVFAVGTLPDDRPYIVMELLDGEDLGRHLDQVGSLDEQHAVELAIHALSGLAHAHKRGVLHRDIKPANLVLVKSDSGEEVLKIVDLGISKLLPSSLIKPGPNDSELGATRTNAVLGSPVYMSPEQCRGAKGMDHRSDVYSVGVVLYECLTGEVPHNGENVNEIMFKIALEDAPDPRTRKPEIDSELAAIVKKALTRDVEQRFQSASEFREALLEWGAERGARVLPTPSSRQMPTPSSGFATAVRDNRDPSSSRRLQVLASEEDEQSEVHPTSALRRAQQEETQQELTSVAAAPLSSRSLAKELEAEERRDKARRQRTLQRSILAAAMLVIVVGSGVLVKRRFWASNHAVVAAAVAAPPPPTVLAPPAAGPTPTPTPTPSASAASMPEPVSPLAAASAKAKRAAGSKPKRSGGGGLASAASKKASSPKKPDGEENGETQPSAAETDDEEE